MFIREVLKVEVMTTLLGTNSERIYRALLSDIESGFLVRNSKLPTEYELCDRFKVSRNTVRKAIKRLIDEEIVTSRQGAGTYVTFQKAEKTANVISIMFQGNPDLLKMCQKMALSNDLLLSVFSHEEKKWLSEYEAKFFRQVLEQKHRLLIAFCTPINPNTDLIGELEGSTTRVIHIEPYQVEPMIGNFITADYYRAGYIAGVNLMIAGYAHCYFGGLLTDGPYSQIQERGFLEALRDQGVGNGQRVMFDDDPVNANYFQLWEDPYRADMDAFVDRFVGKIQTKPAVFCATANRAKLLIDALRPRGLRVPDDVGIIATNVRESRNDDGYGDINQIQFDRFQFYEKAIKCGIGDSFNGIQELVQPKLIKGETVAAR